MIAVLWGHPRSLSTALERVVIERGDFAVFHEPFSCLYYSHQKKMAVPHMHKVANHPSNYEDIKSYIFSIADRSAVFIKDMCYHCHDFLIKDEDFLEKIVNTFIIRDPRRSIASHYSINPEVTREEIGYESQYEIFRKVVDLTGKVPPIIDAEDLQKDPDRMVRIYCDTLGVPHIPEALHWEKGHKKEWDMWEEWHVDASQSTEIHSNARRYETTVDNDPRLKSNFEYHQPFYEEMYRHRLVPGTV